MYSIPDEAEALWNSFQPKDLEEIRRILGNKNHRREICETQVYQEFRQFIF